MAKAILDIEIKGISEAQTGLDGLSQKINQTSQQGKELQEQKKLLEKRLQTNAKALQKLNNEYADGTINAEEYESAVNGVEISNQNATKALIQNTSAIAVNKAELADLRKEQKQAARLINTQADTLDNLRRKLALAQTEYAQLDQSTEEGRKAAERFALEINKLNEEVKDQEKALGDHRRNVGNYGEALQGVTPLLGSFGAGIAGAMSSLSGISEQLEEATKKIDQIGATSTAAGGNIGGLKGAFATVRAGIISATQAGLAFIATPIGAAIAALAAIGTATKAFFDYNAEVQKTNALISGITNESGALVDEIRMQSGAMAEVLGVDQEQIVQNAKVLVQQFGISYEEALQQMENGILATNGANEEFMQSIGEYSTFFADAGYSVEEFADIVNAGFDLGIYSDKLPDALKEADISLREQTTATRDALTNAFGEDFTSNILDQINTGALSTKDALALISEESERVSLTSEQAATLTADVFRGAGEDAGGALKVFEAVNASMSDTTSELDEQGKRLQEDIERQEQVAKARDDAFNSEGIQAFSKVMKDLGAFLSQVFYGTIELIGGVIDFAFVKPFNRAKTIVTTIIDVFVNLGKGLGKLAMKFEPLGNAINKVKQGFTTFIDGFKRGFASFRATLDGLVAYGKSVLNSLSKALEHIGNADFAKAYDALSDIGEDGARAFDRAFNKTMDSAMQDSVKTVEGAMDDASDAAGAGGTNAGQAFKDNFKAEYDKLRQDITRTPVVAQATGVFDQRDMEEVEEKLQNVFNKIQSGEIVEGQQIELFKDGAGTGVTVSTEEYIALAQDRINALQREEEEERRASERRSEDRAKQRIEDEKEAMRKQAEILALARTEEETARFTYEQKLIDLGLFNLAEQDMTQEQLLAKQALENAYNEEIKKIEEQRKKDAQQLIDDELKANADKFNKILEDKQALNDLLAAEDQVAMNNEIQAVIGNEEAIAEIKKRYRLQAIQDEIDATTEMIKTLSDKIAEDSAIEGTGGDLLSDEQVAEYRTRISELKVLLSELGVEFAEINKDPEGNPQTFGEMLGMDEESVEKAKMAVSGFQQGLDVIGDAMQARQMDRLASVDKMVEQGVITEEQANERKDKINKEFARKQQKIDIVQSIINTAQAVTKALGSAFPPANFILAGITAAQGAVQTAMIKKQKFAKGGILSGPSHAQGGINMFSKGGTFFGEAEGGEAILTKGVMSNPTLATMASAINVAGGGVPLFDNGGVLDPIPTATPTERVADLLANATKGRQPVLVVEQLREREQSVDVMESLRTIG